MKNLKVKVNSEAESLEVQQLLEEFFGLESVMFSGSLGWVAWDSRCFSAYPTNTPSFADRCKEITIQELRDMAHQEQDEPFFTPECTLNDQYAEIEQVRQNQKTIDAMREAEGIFGDKQLKGSQWDLQVGGDHYKSMKIQPAKFALENKLDYCQANAIKYICRHESKNGKQDLDKAKHYIDLLIEHYYGDQNAI